jgi:hypothetical protein
MVEGLSAWCWDARPFPDFPARTSVWADGPNWALGHWLNGRAGVAPLAQLVVALAARAGVTLDPGDVNGVVSGYLVEAPMRLRDALEPLALAFNFDAAERNGLPTLVSRDGPAVATLGESDLALPEDRQACADTRVLETPPDELRLRFIDEAADYRLGGLTVRRDPADGGGVQTVDLPVVGLAALAERTGRRVLARAWRRGTPARRISRP